MPNIWAHIQFGKEVLRAIHAVQYMENQKWRTAFQLGCQGPDFLFYDHYLPWQASTPLNKLGSLLHNLHCGPFLLSLFEEARVRPLTDPAVAYTIGFLLHHVLDRHLHPFVFSRSGFKKWHHQRFETAMDSAILMQRANLHTGKTPVAPEIDTEGRLPGGFASDFLRISAIHYPIVSKLITADQLDQAVAQMIQAQKLFFDPTGWKGRLVFGQLAPFSPPLRIPDWDVLNEKRLPWIDPTDRTILHRESAIELWELALEDGIATTAAGIAWLEAGPNEEAALLKDKFSGLLRNISYETGLPCEAGKITFADSVVPS
ncbi:zinc dependent phospholipase C family protein [Cohnella herbarum]|uniref:Zinc dependent phospholipase C family protein n=1 Tax=Cohnella herbarum TaxID=2728023 RepID=A0A7Z2VJB3_9BACL|nr:zinc dependent phospholipase C family protein [Cohnella herbarum]QJD84102.1 zinc dependent phospholipase C family protein [Cohnella herbarum]